MRNHWNCPDGPIFRPEPKPLLTEFSIHQRLLSGKLKVGKDLALVLRFLVYSLWNWVSLETRWRAKCSAWLCCLIQFQKRMLPLLQVLSKLCVIISIFMSLNQFFSSEQQPSQHMPKPVEFSTDIFTCPLFSNIFKRFRCDCTFTLPSLRQDQLLLKPQHLEQN